MNVGGGALARAPTYCAYVTLPTSENIRKKSFLFYVNPSLVYLYSLHEHESIHTDTACNEERRNEYRRRMNEFKRDGYVFDYFYLLLHFFNYFLSISLCDHAESHKAGPGWIYQSSSMYNVTHGP